MIHFSCPGCQQRLSAKAKMAGHTRKCPKCGTPIQIGEKSGSGGDEPKPSVEVEAAAPTTAPEPPLASEALPHHPPERLDRHSHYLICASAHLVATWESNGRGWLVKTTAGMASAVRNRDKIPPEGDFRLIELKMGTTDAGHRLEGIACYQVNRRWALNNLAKGDDAILTAVAGPKGLSREQKSIVRAAIKERFMPEVWAKAEKVLEFLGNDDIHSSRA
jgi:hypothetical protein